MDGTEPQPSLDHIPPSLRLLAILEAVSRSTHPVTPTEVNATLNLPKPTIHRLFATLEAEGYLQRELDGRAYTAGKRLRRLSTGVLSSTRIRTARLAVLTDLSARIGETCNVTVPDRDAMIYLDRVETKWPLRIQLPIGTQVPFTCTASGKMYLSSLNETHLKTLLQTTRLERRTPNTITDPTALFDELMLTRERRFAEDREEFMDGMIALAVPVLESHGRLLSTLSFHAPTQRLPMAEAREHLSALRDAAAALSQLVRSDADDAA